ncbi:hypothetical protein WKK05_12225 [Nostoc sp. UHCC 0302]|uniref:hypothetical protein n=1 Tax=Nostoc sp. UHCC 0302 TaxID=3134896 RepID=UPI00311C89B3
MPYKTLAQQTIKSVVPSCIDEQALAQAELDNHLETQAEAVAPTKDPLTARDRRIIGEIIEVEPETIRTIWLEGGITLWVRFVDGSCLPFDRDWFAKRVAEVKRKSSAIDALLVVKQCNDCSRCSARVLKAAWGNGGGT